MTGDCYVFKFLRLLWTENHLMRFQSETSVFKFFRRSVERAFEVFSVNEAENASLYGVRLISTVKQTDCVCNMQTIGHVWYIRILSETFRKQNGNFVSFFCPSISKKAKHNTKYRNLSLKPRFHVRMVLSCFEANGDAKDNVD